MTPKDFPTAIPQADPRAGYLVQRTAIDAALARVLEGGLYILGREVEMFEAAFADFIGVRHAIGVGSGTDAIELALRATSEPVILCSRSPILQSRDRSGD